MHWANRILFAALVAALVAWGPQQLEIAGGTDELERVQGERDALVSGNAELERDIAGLQAEVRALKQDPAEVARIAREDLNLVAPGEIVFAVERVTPRPATSP